MTAHSLTKNLAMIGAALLLAVSPLVWAQQPTAPADPTVRDVTAGEAIRATRIPDHIYLREVNDPIDIIWDRIPAYRTFLTAAPPVHRSTQLRFDPEWGQHLYFQLARTSERFYVRLRWHDTSQNVVSGVDTFADGAAIQFALKGVDTNYMMGSDAKKPVNIWFWRADSNTVENLAAGGYGSTTVLPEQSVTGKAVFVESDSREPEWHLVMSRKLKSTGKHSAQLRKGTIPVAFALWQGAEDHRDGNKRVSHNWILLDVVPSKPAAQPPK